MSILDKICADKMAHIRAIETETPLSDLQKSPEYREPTRGFIRKIRNTYEQGQAALIAEIKKASPSAGPLRNDFDPPAFACAYEAGGAACLSVLTDTPFFQGKDQDLLAARNACTLPVLRKDFMIAPYQIHESKVLGADCVLLIAAALDDLTLKDLYNLAHDIGLDVLIEVHNEAEMERALHLSPPMIGVNARNLKTLEVFRQTLIDLAAQLPEDIIRVAESGIKTNEDITSLQEAGYQSFLVGETLMRQSNLTKAVKTLLNAP